MLEKPAAASFVIMPHHALWPIWQLDHRHA
jgi:hypothetical protein